MIFIITSNVIVCTHDLLPLFILIKTNLIRDTAIFNVNIDAIDGEFSVNRWKDKEYTKVFTTPFILMQKRVKLKQLKPQAKYPSATTLFLRKCSFF